MWNAAEDATLLADLHAGEIVDAIKSDMPHDEALPGDTSLGALLSLLSAGLAFINFPAGGAGSKVFSTAIQQAPGVGKALMTTGSLGSKVTPLDQIESSLGEILSQLQINLANTLYATQTDFLSFISHASNGSFIANVASLNASTAGLTRQMKTYIVSQALQSHNIIITVARNPNIYGLSQKTFSQPENGTMLPQNSWHVNCQDPPDEHGVCDNWWLDNMTNDSYALFKLDDMEHNYYGLMETIFGAGWTTGAELFIGADDCANTALRLDVGRFDLEGSYFPGIDPTDFESRCYSNLRVCDWNQTNDLNNRDAEEFYPSAGCAFAWPNFCVPGQGFFSSEAGDQIESSLLSPEDQSSIIVENVRSGAHVAFVTQTSKTVVLGEWSQGYSAPSLSFDRHKLVFNELYAYNSLYDLINTQFDALQAQAKSMDSKSCKEYPKNGRAGWGGAGYVVHDQGCNRYPASYLGAGLYFNTELCGPLP